MQQIALDIGVPVGPTLANFLVGPNQSAWQHMKLWVGAQGTVSMRSPVPCYLWGDSGSGKSHLLKAACEALREQGARVGWLQTGELDPAEFDPDWAAVVLDDVHTYTAAQQHAAFNWFVNAQTHLCPVLAAGRVPPVQLPLREDLRTRLGWGHLFQMQLLAEPECRAVLRRAADERGVFLSDEVMDYMLNRFSRDLGSLLELLDRLDRYALQTQRGMTVPLLKSMMENV